MDTLEQRRSSRLLDKREAQDLEAARIAAGMHTPVTPQTIVVDDPSNNPTVMESRARNQDLRKLVFNNQPDLLSAAHEGYLQDPLYSKILDDPKSYKAFKVKDKLLWVHNRIGECVLCVPRGNLGEKTIQGAILEKAHEVVGHFGSQQTIDYVRRWFWWPRMSSNAHKFCDTCDNCQRSKTPYHKPYGLLHSLPVPTRPWESVGMDCVGPFPESQGYNYLWVVICCFSSMVHLIPI